MVDLKVQGLAELRHKLAAIPAELQRQERAVMHKALLGLETEAKARIHSRTGRARRGIRSDVAGSGNDLQGRVQTRSKAARFSQRGRRPGGQPKIRVILRWLQRSGHEASPATAFLVARAIARHGTKGHPIMEAVLRAKKSQVVQDFKQALHDAVRRAK